MKMRKTSSFVTTLVILTLALYPFAAVAAPAGKDVITLKPGALKGTIANTTGQGVPEMPVSVIDKAGETVVKTVTDESGKFMLKDLDEGGYTLAVGKDHRLKLALKEDAGSSEMKVVVPEEDPALAGGFTVTTLVVGGTVIAIITGVAIAVNDSDGSDRSPTSP